MHWLVAQLPEFRELWRAAHGIRRQGITLLYLATHQHSYEPSQASQMHSDATRPPAESALGHLTPELGYEGPHQIPGVDLDRRLKELEEKLEELLENRNQMTTTNSESIRSPSGSS